MGHGFIVTDAGQFRLLLLLTWQTRADQADSGGELTGALRSMDLRGSVAMVGFDDFPPPR